MGRDKGEFVFAYNAAYQLQAHTSYITKPACTRNAGSSWFSS